MTLPLPRSYLAPNQNSVNSSEPAIREFASRITSLLIFRTALPMGPLSGLKDAQLVGISRSAPEVTGDKETASAGALAGAEAGGGAANVQQLLPRHKGAVQRFFKPEN